MAGPSVIITNPNIFTSNIYVNSYLADYHSSESSDSSAPNYLEKIPVQMQNISSTSYSDILNEPFDTIDLEQRRQLCLPVLGEPYLTVIEEPKNQLRFRYKSEKGKHGGLKPAVKLNNYSGTGDIYIKVSLYTNDANPVLHVFELEAKTSENGIIQQKLSKDKIARFPSLSVYTKKKDEVLSILQNRIKGKYKEQRKKINEEAIKKEAQEEIKKLNLNAGRLCFEAFHNNKPICNKIFSEPFYDQKCTTAGDLKIIRLSSWSGKSSGGDEIILLCEKIRKDDIEVHFFEQDDDGKIIWEAIGEFNPSDVHHQVAIPFKTPQFRQNLEKNVYICLYRKSDQKNGDAVKFHYIKDEQWNYDFSVRSSKRKKPNHGSMFEQQIAGTSNIPQNSPSSIADAVNCNSPVVDWDFFNSCDNLNLYEDLFYIPMQENVNVEAAVSSVSFALSKTNIKNSTNVNKSSSNSSTLFKQIQNLKNGIANILKTRDVDAFVNFLPVLMKIKDEKNNTLLHLVILEKDDNLLLLISLLQFAPKDLINQKNDLHLTPLHLAVRKGLWKYARVLLRFGANPNLKNQEGSNCVHLAAKYNFPQCLFEVLAPLFCDKIKNTMPEINALNYEGFAPLHLSVTNESEKCTQLLVQSKADINITDGKSGKTPLHIAYDLKNSKLIEYFLSQPDINRRATDFRGFAPCSVISYAKSSESTNAKPSECCIEMSSESNQSLEEDNCENSKEEKLPTIEDIEEKLLEILSSKKLWKKLGIYLMEKKELDIIEELEPAPAKSILKEFKKKHKENYLKELKSIFFNDASLKHLYKELSLSHL